MTNRLEENLSLFFAGVLLGGVAATLTAPYSGRRMRRLARRKIEDGAEQFSEVARDLLQTRDDLLSRGEKLMCSAGKNFV